MRTAAYIKPVAPPLWELPTPAVCNCALCQDHGWHIPAAPMRPETPQMRAAKARVEHRHLMALRHRGIPMRDLMEGPDWLFGVVRVAGREMIVTDDVRLRAYLYGPGLFAMPGDGE